MIKKIIEDLKTPQKGRIRCWLMVLLIASLPSLAIISATETYVVECTDKVTGKKYLAEAERGTPACTGLPVYMDEIKGKSH